ncbi:MAG: cytochrome c1 [Methylacidiphilales bacterium]|nr:cytochrome c1 [Candidatus Methylacidiphilales bacterium]
MKFYNPLILIAIVGLIANSFSVAGASQDGVTLLTAPINTSDKASLQRGARAFMDYCSGCHSLKYATYNQFGNILGMGVDSSEIIKKYLIYPLDSFGEKIKYGEKVSAGLEENYAIQVYLTKVPDLSLITRVRNKDWLYSYLTGFYRDTTKQTGFNNVIFKDVAMPNPFWEIQGIQYLEDSETKNANLIVHKEGLLSKTEFHAFVLDIVNFLTVLSDPSKSERERIGIWVVMFLVLLSIVTYFLHLSYWKEVENKRN